MNLVRYYSPFKESSIVFCIVDDINSYATNGIKETIKNLADFTLSNIYAKGYDSIVGFDEDLLLRTATESGYTHAVLLSPGTEFINGTLFFDELEKSITESFFLMGHILDRGDAYYELHHQCFVVNLTLYQKLGCPNIGKMQLGSSHRQTIPNRSNENWHDDYTPIAVWQGTTEKDYSHRCHGWNILSIAFKNGLPVLTFNETFRASKLHYYPESKKDFDEKVSWLYYRMNYCLTEFVHTKNNEWGNQISGTFDQIILPASGTLYLDHINSGSVIFYDYNQRALDYWKDQCPKKSNVEYKFVKTDLLVDNNLVDYIDTSAKNTLINLSNIFCYEGTAPVYSLDYRLRRENQLISILKRLVPSGIVNFTMRAACGFVQTSIVNTIDEVEEIPLQSLVKPTWHYNSDWL